MEQLKPHISACIISCNQQGYIAEELEGALMQELDVPHEIVISNGCSTNNTPNIFREFIKKDARTRIIERSENIGTHQD
jgi:glycosyltransferase involved in cell wall biosynthesis